MDPGRRAELPAPGVARHGRTGLLDRVRKPGFVCAVSRRFTYPASEPVRAGYAGPAAKQGRTPAAEGEDHRARGQYRRATSGTRAGERSGSAIAAGTRGSGDGRDFGVNSPCRSGIQTEVSIL